MHLQLIPKNLQKILKKCLELDLEKRYNDITDFIQDIKNYKNSESFQKEQRGRDFSGDISHLLKEAQDTLLPPHPPHWPILHWRVHAQNPPSNRSLLRLF